MLAFVSGFNYAQAQNPPPAKVKMETKISLKELFDTSILWAVPKHRKTLEKRIQKKFGMKDRVWKMLMPRTDLTVCNTCGYTHHKKTLCGKHPVESLNNKLGIGMKGNKIFT